MTAGRRRVLLVAGVLAVDYATALLAHGLALPFYLDTWATSTGVIVGGLAVGIAGGVLYNLVMALTVWGPAACVWSLSSATAALCTWLFLRQGWVSIERPFAMVGSGVATGIVNGCLSLGLSFVAFGGAPAADNRRAFREILQANLGNSGLAILCASLVVEVADKTVSIITAAATAFLLADAYRWARAHRAAHDGRTGRPPSRLTPGQPTRAAR